jgi:hypothetical protein
MCGWPLVRTKCTHCWRGPCDGHRSGIALRRSVGADGCTRNLAPPAWRKCSCVLRSCVQSDTLPHDLLSSNSRPTDSSSRGRRAVAVDGRGEQARGAGTCGWSEREKNRDNLSTVWSAEPLRNQRLRRVWIAACRCTRRHAGIRGWPASLAAADARQPAGRPGAVAAAGIPSGNGAAGHGWLRRARAAGAAYPWPAVAGGTADAGRQSGE